MSFLQQSLCMVVHKATEAGTSASCGIGDEAWERLTGHVSDEHATFLRAWDHIVDLEAAEYVREQPWLHTSAEQEKRGRCLSDMVLERQEVSNGAYLYHFRKRLVQPDAASPTSQSSRTSLLDLFEVTRGDFVSLSTEDGHYGVARGSVADLAPQHIVIALDDELRVLPRVTEEGGAAVAEGGGVPAPLEGLLDVEREFECLTPGSPLGPSHHYRSRTRLRDLVAKQQVWRIDREDLVSTEVRVSSLNTSVSSKVAERYGPGNRPCQRGYTPHASRVDATLARGGPDAASVRLCRRRRAPGRAAGRVAERSQR